LLDKIDVRDIVHDHLRTLVSYDTRRVALGDYLLFYALPLIAAAVCYTAGIGLSTAAVGVLIDAVAILAGLLFNLLVLVHGFSRTATPTTEEDKRQLLSETYSNIAYAILVALLALVPLALLANTSGCTTLLLGSIAVFLLVHFGLTLLLVLKRIHTLVSFGLRSARP
jgi:hypothetical protein